MSTIKGANTLSSGYDVANSCMFNPGDNPELSRSTGDGNEDVGSFSFWWKPAKAPGGAIFYTVYVDSSNFFDINVDGGGNFQVRNKLSGSYNLNFESSATYRDPSAWYNFVVLVDTTQSTEANRMKAYVNGTQITSWQTATYPSQNTDMIMNSNSRTAYISHSGDRMHGYLAEFVLIDGTAQVVGDFGEFDSDSPTIWKPKDVSGLTKGTNGFYLDFEDSGTLGNCAFGGTDFTVSNLAATDQMTDTPTNNFATLNPLIKGNTSFTFLEGNLQVDSGNNWGHGAGTIGLANGKWYWEVDNITAASNVFFGICNEFNLSHLDGDSTPYSEAGLMLYFQDGRRTIDGSDSEGEYTAYGTTHGFALDLDSGTRTIKFYRDNSLEGTENLTANFVAGEFVFPVLLMSASSNACGVDYNFGNEVTALASGAADANGYGNFEFAPPSGYYAICSKNLAEYG